MSIRPVPQEPRLLQVAQGHELELVLSAVTELVRVQREILQTVQRLEVSLDELHDRLEARADPPGAPGSRHPGAEAPATDEDDAHAPLSDDELLREIQRTARLGGRGVGPT